MIRVGKSRSYGKVLSSPGILQWWVSTGWALLINSRSACWEFPQNADRRALKASAHVYLCASLLPPVDFASNTGHGKSTAFETISPLLWTFYFPFPSGVLFCPMTEVKGFFSVEAVLRKERRWAILSQSSSLYHREQVPCLIHLIKCGELGRWRLFMYESVQSSTNLEEPHGDMITKYIK